MFYLFLYVNDGRDLSELLFRERAKMPSHWNPIFNFKKKELYTS